MQDTFKALKDKYAHLEFSILSLSSALKDNETKRLDSEYFKNEYLENEELLKRFDCQVLGEICNKICNGSTPENGDFEKEGIPFFRSQDFNLLDTEPNQCITAAFHNTLLRSKVKYKDILIAIIGATLGKIGFVGENIAEANINQNIAKISINNNKFNPYFVAIFLDTYYGQYQIFRLATQTAQEYLNNIQVAKIKIPLFDDSFQKDIEKIVKDSHHKLEQSKALYKEAEILLYESLGIANSSLGNHCVDLANFECSQTPSLASHSKFAKNSTSTSASRRLDERSEVPNTRILGESQGDSAEFNAESSENNSVIARLDEVKSWQSTVEINPHEVRTLKGVVGGGERLRGEGSDFAIKAPSPLAEKATKDSKNLTESRRSERVESHIESFTKSAESTKDSNNIDCHDLTSSSLAMTARDTSSDSAQSTLQNNTPQNFKARFPHLNFSIKPLSLSLQKSGRLDSEYYQSKYENIEALIKSRLCRRLGDLVSIKKSIEPGSEAYQSEGIEFVRVSNLSKFGISKSDIYLSKEKFGKDLAKLAPQKETILLSKDGSVGISYCVEENLDCITSGAILHLRVKDKKQILPQVLSLILNSITTQLQAERDSGGSIIAHWKISEIENILIPLLDSQIQEQIASKLKLSFALKKEAKELLNLAKSKVESAIESKP